MVILAVSGCAPSARLVAVGCRGGTSAEGGESLLVRANIQTSGLEGQQIVYRVRLLNQDRDPLISTDRRFRDEEGAIAASNTFMAFGSPWIAEGVMVGIPVEQIDAKGGERPSYAEITVELPDGKRLDQALADVPPEYGPAPDFAGATPPNEIPTPDEEATQYTTEPELASDEASSETEVVDAAEADVGSPPIAETSGEVGAEPVPVGVASMGNGGEPAGAASEGGAVLGTVADPDPSAVASPRSADEVAASEIETAEEPVTAPGDLPLPPVEVIRPGEARAEKVIPSADSTPGRTMYRLYLVRPGDSLWRISDKYLNDGARWREIFDLNRARLETPDRLPVGTELLIPRE